MKHSQKSHLMLSILLCALLACASAQKASLMEKAPPGAPVQTVEVTAQKYRFTPEEVRVKRGAVVRLVLRSLDTGHGISIPHFGIDVDIPRKGGGDATVELYAREAGTYAFHCSNFCGMGHFGMKGKLIVEE